MHHPKRELSRAEAVFAFAAWLVQRKDELRLGARYNTEDTIQIVARLALKFCQANRLTQETAERGLRDWAKLVVIPTEDNRERRRR